MSTDGIRGLPAQPLTEAQLRSLASHRSIGICYPIYQLADGSNAIISLYLGINDRIHFLLYNPVEEQWEQLKTIDEPESLMEASGLDTETIQSQFDMYYAEDEVEPAGYLTDPLDAFAANFPQEPLTDDQLAAISERSYIVSAVPFIRQQSEGDSIAALLVFDDPIKAVRLVGSYGYDQTAGTWQLLSTASLSESNYEKALEPLAADTSEWIFERYSQGEVRLADDTGDAIDSDSR